MTRKSAAPGSLRLWIYTEQKVSPAFRNVPRKNVHTRQPSAFCQSPAKSSSSLRRCTPKERSGQTAFGYLFPPTTSPLKRPAAIARKSAAPDSFRLLVGTLQKAPPAFGDIPRKNVYARPPPTTFSHRSRGSPSSPLRCPEKVRLKTASGFWSILCKKSRQRPEIYPGKMFTPVRFRLPFHTGREAPQAARCDDPKKCGSRQSSAFGRSPAKGPSSLRRCVLKNVHIRQSSAFGRSPAKSPVSLRRYTPEKCLRPSAFGCFFPPIVRCPKWPAAITRKSTAPDSL